MSLISSILNPFRVDTDVARLLTVAQSVGGFTVPDPQTSASDAHIQGVNAPGLVNGSVAVLFYRAVTRGSGTYHVRLQSANGTTQPTEHAISALDAGPSSWQEVIPAGLLTSDNNELIFAVSVDSAGTSVTFSDVAILYKSNKLTIPRPPIFAP